MKEQSVKRKVQNTSSKSKRICLRSTRASLVSKLLIVVLLFTLCSLLLAFTPALAQTTCKEVPLPTLPGAPDPCSSPAAYITYWFYFSLYLAGIAALLIFVGAGVLRITGGLMPASITKANNLMINAALGLILLFGGWVLLTILNPALTTLRNPPPFFNLTSCTIGFIPSVAQKEQSIKLFWQGLNKDAKAPAYRVCDNPEIPDEEVSLIGEKSVSLTREGSTKCDLILNDKNGNILQTCSGVIAVSVPFEKVEGEAALAQALLPTCGGSKSCGGVGSCATLQAVANGEPPPVCSCACTLSSSCSLQSIHLSIDMLTYLDGMNKACTTGSKTCFTITSLTTDGHGCDSTHYKGKAVDLQPRSSTTYSDLESALRSGVYGLRRPSWIQCEVEGSTKPVSCTNSSVNHIHAQWP